MFLIDKYEPKSKEDILFHNEIYDHLENMAQDNSLQHIIFHGPPGSGKKTMINIFLKMLFGEEIYNTYTVEYDVKGSNNKSNKEKITRSNYHVILKPTQTNYDRHLLQFVVKEYAKCIEFGSLSTRQKFKIIQIDELDKFGHIPQSSIIRTIENYSKSCRFIMSCESLSKVIIPIRSRCMCIPVASLSDSELFMVLCQITAKECITLPLKDMYSIVEKSNGQVKTALWNVQMKLCGMNNEIDYEKSIKILVNNILKCNPSIHDTIIRDILSKYIITMIPHTIIIRDIMNELVKSDLDDSVLIKITIKVAECEYDCTRGRRQSIHMDKMIISIMNILIKHKEKNKRK
jgi:replication factor C subunit 3/5